MMRSPVSWPHMDVSSPRMAVSSPRMDVSSPRMDVSSPAVNVSWPGLSRPPTTSPNRPVSWRDAHRPPTASHKPNRQIIPFRIARNDQADLPGPGPTLQASLSLNRGEHIAVRLGVYQAVELVTTGEPGPDTILVCPDAPGQIASHAEIQRSVRAVCHDVDPPGRHTEDGARYWLTKSLRPAAGDTAAFDEKPRLNDTRRLDPKRLAARGRAQ